jgi:hypothetical protein
MLCDQSIFSLFPTVNFLVSEPTMKDTPVGVDFYRIGERGRQHGPFGVLHPLHNVAGVSLEDIVNLSHIDKSRHFSLTHSLTHSLTTYSLLFRKVITLAKDMTTIKKFVHSAQMVLWTRT